MLRQRLAAACTPSPLKGGVLVTLFLIAILNLLPPVFQEFMKSVDERIQDAMFVVRGRAPIAQRDLYATVVDIDEKSLKELGQWPWPRSVIAELTRRIRDCGPKAIGFDIVFAEPDRTSLRRQLPELMRLTGRTAKVPEGHPDLSLCGPAEFEEELARAEAHLRQAASEILDIKAFPGEHAPVLDNDLALARVIRATPEAVLGYFFQFENDGRKDKEFPATPYGEGILHVDCPEGVDPWSLWDLYGREPYRPILNIPVLDDAAQERCGYFNPSDLPSGMVRVVPLCLPYGGMEGKTLYASLSLQMLRIGYKVDHGELVADERGVLGLRMGGRTIETDRIGRLPANYRGPAKTFDYIPAVDVLQGGVDPARLRDKYVLIGSSAGGLLDLRSQPFEEACPGVEIHATIIDNILRNDYIRVPPWDRMAEVVLMLILGLVLSVVLARVRPWIGATLTVAVAAGLVCGVYYLLFLDPRHLRFSLSYPLLLVFVVFMAMSTLNYFFEGRQKRYISSAFSRYLSPALVERLAENPGLLTLEGEQKKLTVLFSDIRDFTSMSEKMTAPDLSKFLNEYLTPMADIVMETSGTVDKFIGDEVVAFWGAPLDDEEHAVHGARAALRMLARLHELQAQWTARNLPPIEIGIGINTGLMSVGNMGSNTRFDYTIMGDNVNLGSRLEGLNKQYGTHLLISEPTRMAIGPSFFCRQVDLVRVKGRAQPVRIYELLCEGDPDEALRKEAETFEAALADYQVGRFAEALAKFESAEAVRPHDLHAVFLKRCAQFLENPPGPEWDGVYTATEK